MVAEGKRGCGGAFSKSSPHKKYFSRNVCFPKDLFEERRPLFPILTDDSDDGEHDDDRVREDRGGCQRDVINQPKQDVAKRKNSADRGIFLHHCPREEPYCDERKDVPSVLIRKHRHNGKADTKNNDKPNRKIHLLVAKHKADDRQDDGNHHNAARAESVLEDVLHAKERVGKELADNDDLHTFELHARNGKKRCEDADDQSNDLIILFHVFSLS